MPKATKEVPALVLTLGNAPEEFHVVPGYVGLFHPTIPAPVGEPGENSLDMAKAAHSDPGCHLELVNIASNEAKDARAKHAVAQRNAANGVRANIRAKDGAEVQRAVAENKAVVQERGVNHDNPED